MTTNKYPEPPENNKNSEKEYWKKVREVKRIFDELNKPKITFTVGEQNAYLG